MPGPAASGTPAGNAPPVPQGGKKGLEGATLKASKAPFVADKGSNARLASRQRTSQKVGGAKLDAQLDEPGWAGPAPWEMGPNADNCPRFLCDIMVRFLPRPPLASCFSSQKEGQRGVS